MEEAEKKIKNAWIAALISGTLTLLVTLYAVFGESIMGFDAWAFFDVALIFGLAYGIYRKSRTCAVVMLVYFVAAKIFLIAQTGTASGLPLALVFIYFYALGVVGTFRYHALRAQGGGDPA